MIKTLPSTTTKLSVRNAQPVAEPSPDPYSDIEFLTLFQEMSKEHLAIIVDAISPTDEGPPAVASKRFYQEDFVSDLNYLKPRILSFVENQGPNVVLFNALDDFDYCSRALFQFSKMMAEQSSLDVLVVDCDLRSSHLNRYFELRPKTGLSEYLMQNKSVDALIAHTPQENLHWLPCGSPAADPVSLFMADDFISLMDSLKTQFDILLINTPAYNNFVDTFLLTKYLEPVVLLTLTDVDNWKGVEAFRRELSVLGVKIFGLLNI
ncbi:MAG: hypothetical protein ACE5HS_14730 [bacterium]